MSAASTMARCGVLLALLLSAGCAKPGPAPAPPSEPPPLRATDLPRVGHFAGTVPCADCAAVEVELMLSADWDGRNLYHLVEVRRGGAGGDRRVESDGAWESSRGTPADPAAVVYQLNPDRPGQRRYFVVVDEHSIRLLDDTLTATGAPLTRVDGR